MRNQAGAVLAVAVALALSGACQAGCPFSHGQPNNDASVLPSGHPPVMRASKPGVLTDLSRATLLKPQPEYDAAVRSLDFSAVQDDLKILFRDSKDWWPADYGHYGPFFVRLAWHCSGTYRVTDGRGGCEGGRQRFDPERSWDDNTNLDKARKLLMPLKAKYGKALSWGDLFILAGTTAIADMGGPVLGFCGGRVDDDDGYWSQELGPTPEQEAYAPCPVNGTCKRPLGSTTIGLIYLNPQGPMGNPVPEQSAPEVRDTFGRMAMNDTETVALIGGGHTFGKTHGACPKGPGPNPKQSPANPWPGECGSGKGADAVTSGIEGPWTPEPIVWDNAYFKQLHALKFEVHTGPGGAHQWRVPLSASDRPTAPAPDDKTRREDIMMLTTDVALTKDEAYAKIVQTFAEDQPSFDQAFSNAWYKLTTRDRGPYTRCVGAHVPEPQPFQNPLPPPPPPSELADMAAVKAEVKRAIVTPQPSVLAPDEYLGEPTYGPLFVRLAWQCASTFRATDFQGGCNGARLRFSPEKDWPINAALDRALALLQPVMETFPKGLSWADLIALAGTVALEEATNVAIPFCPGRTDATDGAGSEYISPTISPDGNVSAYDVVASVRAGIKLSGLSAPMYAALVGGGHSLGRMHIDRSGFNGTWSPTPTKVDNSWFRDLLDQDWELVTVEATGKQLYKARNKDIHRLASDMAFAWDPELAGISEAFAEDNTHFVNTLAHAWTTILNADRFDGPTGNLCSKDAAAPSADNKTPGAEV
eukprot:m.478160 g.478160  ORF g.478160 m.478160 type:complete len:758 (-) comp21053_c0_seq1:38-2311(-)